MSCQLPYNDRVRSTAIVIIIIIIIIIIMQL